MHRVWNFYLPQGSRAGSRGDIDPSNMGGEKYLASRDEEIWSAWPKSSRTMGPTSTYEQVGYYKDVLEIKCENLVRLTEGGAVGRVRRRREHHEARREFDGPRHNCDANMFAGAGASAGQAMLGGEAYTVKPRRTVDTHTNVMGLTTTARLDNVDEVLKGRTSEYACGRAAVKCDQ